MLAGSRTAAGLVTVLVVGLLSACTAAVGASSADEPRVAMLRSVQDEDHEVFVDELRRQGWHVGRDVTLLPRDPSETYDDLDEVRAALRSWHAERPLDLIVAFSTPYAQLAIEEYPRIPTLFMVNDPVASGLVDEPDAPKGPASGVSFWTPPDRTLALAERAIGGLDRLGYLAPADDPAVAGHRQAALTAARGTGRTVIEATFREGDRASIAAATAELAAADADAVWLTNSNATLRSLPLLEQELDEHGLPTIANIDQATFAVVVLTPDSAELRRQLGRQVARVLAGTTVASVPVEAPRRFTLILNASQLRGFGRPELPRELVRQADLVR